MKDLLKYAVLCSSVFMLASCSNIDDDDDDISYYNDGYGSHAKNAGKICSRNFNPASGDYKRCVDRIMSGGNDYRRYSRGMSANKAEKICGRNFNPASGDYDRCLERLIR